MKAASVFWIFSTTFILAFSGKQTAGSLTTFCHGKQMGNYPDPDRCDGFVTCVGVRAVKMDCPAGLHYNYQKDYCDWQHNVKCQKKGTPPTDPPTPPPPSPQPGIKISQEGCGRDKTFIEIEQVVGGFEAVPNSWIWQGGMYSDEGFVCGGALIAKNLFLTAAHCVKGMTGVTIRMGDHNRTKGENTEQELPLKKVKVHKRFSGYTLVNDIALLKIDGNFNLNDNVGTVCLPQEHADPPSPPGSCYITGWGRTAIDEPTSDVLQEAKMPWVTNVDCAKRNKNPITGESQITDKMLCAGFKDQKSKVSGCRGDSGGPYVCKADGAGKKWFLHGVVSWGSSICSASAKFTVFTKITKYIKWIKQAAATI